LRIDKAFGNFRKPDYKNNNKKDSVALRDLFRLLPGRICGDRRREDESGLGCGEDWTGWTKDTALSCQWHVDSTWRPTTSTRRARRRSLTM